MTNEPFIHEVFRAHLALYRHQNIKGTMMLIDLIKWLEKQDPSYIVTHGFGEPASYRGNYADVAFVPKENVTFGSMLAHARSALNSTFSGYKGGQYTMHEYVEAYIAEYGECVNADRIGLTMMKLWEENARDNKP